MATKNIKIIDHKKNGFEIISTQGVIRFTPQDEEEVRNFLLSKKEAQDKKDFPMKHTMVTKFSEMNNHEVRMEMKIRNETFAGTIKKVKK